jgi:[ribosomal protein S18]-alanine N-acetyltransferase
MGGGARASAQGVNEEETVTLELALRGDLSAIAELERESFADPWSLASFESVLDEPAAFFAVANTASSKPAGYVVAWFAADEGEIANLAVREPTRRRGIGSMLLAGALAEGKRRGARNMYLEVRESNEAARRLYTARGFEEIGRRKHYYRHPVEDAIVLRLEME